MPGESLVLAGADARQFGAQLVGEPHRGYMRSYGVPGKA